MDLTNVRDETRFVMFTLIRSYRLFNIVSHNLNVATKPPHTNEFKRLCPLGLCCRGLALYIFRVLNDGVSVTLVF